MLCLLMNKRILAISSSVVIGTIVLVFTLSSVELPYYQSSALKYEINTQCQLYSAFLSEKIKPSSGLSTINPELNELLDELLQVDPVKNYDSIISENPQCENEFRKLN